MSGIVLATLKKELVSLTNKAKKAKQDVDDYINVGTEKIEIYQELAEIIKAGDHGSQSQLSKLRKLQEREERANEILKNDIITLMDKQIDADSNLQELQREVSQVEWRKNMTTQSKD